MKIVGNTVGTTLPKPNLDQTDPTKGDYILGDRSFTKGDKGDKGDPGDRGPQGNPGIQGEPGPAGADGKTPVKGTDYYTEEDKVEMVEMVLDSIPRVTKVSTVREDSKTTMTLTMSEGAPSTIVINYGESGDPSDITVDGMAITLEFETIKNVVDAVYWIENGVVNTAVFGELGGTTNGSRTIYAGKSLKSTKLFDVTNYDQLEVTIKSQIWVEVNAFLVAEDGTKTALFSVKSNEDLDGWSRTVDISGYSGNYYIQIAAEGADPTYDRCTVLEAVFSQAVSA